MKKEDNIQTKGPTMDTSKGSICKMRRSRTTSEGPNVQITKSQRPLSKEKKKKNGKELNYPAYLQSEKGDGNEVALKM